jgi:hypothetical protein
MALEEEAFRKILIESPLYTKFMEADFEYEHQTEGTFNLLKIMPETRVQFDCFCVGCGQEATFLRGARASGGAGYNTFISAAQDTFVIRMQCTRNSHAYYTWFQAIEGGLQKIGMTPSMEDIANSDLKKYRGLLSKKQLSELHRAGGLASHGIGIGSFVYLRRIFEKQIADHYQRRVSESGEIEGFETLRVADKIKAIEEYLPRTLAKHREMYGILSMGVHELDEKTCLDFFPPLRQAIIMILEQDYQIKEREAQEKALEESFANMTMALPKA